MTCRFGILDIFSLLTYYSDRYYSLKHRNPTMSFCFLKYFSGMVYVDQSMVIRRGLPSLIICASVAIILNCLYSSSYNQATMLLLAWESLRPCFWMFSLFFAMAAYTHETHTLPTSSHLTSASNLTPNWSTPMYIFCKFQHHLLWQAFFHAVRLNYVPSSVKSLLPSNWHMEVNINFSGSSGARIVFYSFVSLVYPW